MNSVRCYPLGGPQVVRLKSFRCYPRGGPQVVRLNSIRCYPRGGPQVVRLNSVHCYPRGATDGDFEKIFGNLNSFSDEKEPRLNIILKLRVFNLMR